MFAKNVDVVVLTFRIYVQIYFIWTIEQNSNRFAKRLRTSRCTRSRERGVRAGIH